MKSCSKKFSTQLRSGPKWHRFGVRGELLNRQRTLGKGLCNQIAAVLRSKTAGAGYSCSKTAAKFSPPELALSGSGPSKHAGGQSRSGCRKTRGVAGFTLVEVMITVGILGIFVAAGVAAIVTDQVCTRKAKEEAISMDFLTKYVENIKALPFASVAQGLPINSIYNGTGGSPLISIPPNGFWVSLNTTGFQTFYPDLLWLSNRNPTMQVNLTQHSVAGTLHDIEINVRIDWDAPLSKGGRLEVEVDSLRTVSVPTL
jgi:prepilin-type N-terminal cleavage/methylation domain-containing protein